MTMMTNIKARPANTALSNHNSQFSRLSPISSMFRMSSAWWENSSQTPALAGLRKAKYVAMAVKKAQKEKSAME
jgi:hypothetical protein